MRRKHRQAAGFGCTEDVWAKARWSREIDIRSYLRFQSWRARATGFTTPEQVHFFMLCWPMTPRQPGWNSAVPERVFNNTDWKSVVWTNPQSTASSFQLATLYRMQLSLLTILVVWQHILTSLCLFYGMTWNSSLIQRKSVSPVIRCDV